MKPIGIIVFPGTQCDQDTKKACVKADKESSFLWYKDSFDYKKFSALILPGGFSYGDYLRAGALASKSPALRSVQEASEKGWPILGICNGFQILCEAGLLPGALTPNNQLQFISQWVEIKSHTTCAFGSSKNKIFKLPIAHMEGRYIASEKTLKELKQNDQIWMTYTKNPNGSTLDIAGIVNKKKNVAGLMPHPERATESWMGSLDGLQFFINIGLSV